MGIGKVVGMAPAPSGPTRDTDRRQTGADPADTQMAATPAEAVAHETPVVKLNFNVSPSVAKEVRALAQQLNVSMTQLFRYAFGILKIATAEAKKNHKLVIADEHGNALREIVLPH